MSEKKDGGTAFPLITESRDNAGQTRPGMTLRQWYAGQVLAGATAYAGMAESKYISRLLAKTAFSYADAMIEYEAEEK